MIHLNSGEIELIEGMDNQDISRWISSRFLKYHNRIGMNDLFGFPIGPYFQRVRIDDGIKTRVVPTEGSYIPGDFLVDAYQLGNAEFKGRFEIVLRTDLENKISGINPNSPVDDLSYASHGIEVIGFGHLNPLHDILVSLIDPKYDFDFSNNNQWNNPQNLYVESVGMLSLLEADLHEEFWDRLLDDPRTAANSVAPRSFDFPTRILRIIKHYESVYPPAASFLASHNFGDYILPDPYNERGTNPVFDPILINRKRDELEKMIKESGKPSEIQERLLQDLQSAISLIEGASQSIHRK